MFRCIMKEEMYRVLHNPLLWASLALGLIFALMDSYHTWIGIQEKVRDLFTSPPPYYYQHLGLFGLNMIVDGESLGAYYYHVIWPIMAAVPFGWSYFKDRKTGFIYQIMSRSGKKMFFWAKFSAVFISGGMILAFPLLFNLFVDALFCPAVLPTSVDSYYPVFNGWFLSRLFYSHPWIHALLFCLNVFIWGGATASLCFVAGNSLRLSVLVMMFPFALYEILQILMESFIYGGRTDVIVMLSPMFMVTAAPPAANPFWLLLLMAVGYTLLGAFALYLQVFRREL